MRVSYGSGDREYPKHLVHQADSFLRKFLFNIQPGRLLVDVFPSLRFVPSWLPGAGWKHTLGHISLMKETVTREPFEQSKKRLVRWH